MAAHGIGCPVLPRGSANVARGGVRPPLENMKGGVPKVAISELRCALPSRLSRSVRSGRKDLRVLVRHGVEASAAGAPAKEDIWVADGVSNRYPKARLTSLLEFEIVQTRGWSEAARDEIASLKVGRVADLRAREAFANGGDITEGNMERLVEALLREEGQSGEDYQRRADMFHKIAEFFSQGRTYSVEEEEFSSSAAHAGRTIQRLLEVSLADEGRSAIDYNVRAQVFAKSAEVFPFNTDIRLI